MKQDLNRIAAFAGCFQPAKEFQQKILERNTVIEMKGA